MPFIPKPYPFGTVFELGRRIKLADNKRATYKTAPSSAAKNVLLVSSYKGDKSNVTCNGDGQFRPVGGAQGIIVRSNSLTSDVLVIWRDSQEINCALVLEVPADAFVTHRGASRFAGEPALDPSQQSAATAPAVTTANPAKEITDMSTATTATLDVSSALETIRQALQPQATVDEDKVRSLVEDAVRDSLQTMQDQLDALLSGPAATKARARAAVGQASSSNPIMAALQSRYVVGQEAPANVLLCAPPSLGKSFAVREFGKQYDLYLEHGCTDDIDEIATLLGGPVPDGSGFVMADGVLTQAVRAASQGQAVLLLLDEVLRLGDRPQEWLLSFLTGVKTTTGKMYRLRTRRVDNGALEVIECPVANLHIAAAANLGARTPLEAFWSRWEVVRFGFDIATVKGIATTVAASYGITHADALGARFAEAVSFSRQCIASNVLRYPLDIRVLERACQFAQAADADGVLAYLATRVSDTCAHWSIDLGETDPASKPAVDQLVTLLTAPTK